MSHSQAPGCRGTHLIIIKNRNGDTKITRPDNIPFKLEMKDLTVEHKPDRGATDEQTTELPNKPALEDGHTPRSAENARAKIEPNDAFQPGTTWKGVCSFIYPANYPQGFLVELTVEKRLGNRFEGLYKAPDKNNACRVKGTITNGAITWEQTKAISGGFLKLGKHSFSGSISSERIDFQSDHLTGEGKPARAKGYFTREFSASPDRQKGTGVE